MYTKHFRIALLGAICAGAQISSQAVQFSYLDPAYTQEIYTAPNSGLGLTWADGNLVTRDDIYGPGNALKEYVTSPNTTVNGTSVRSFTPHTVSGIGSGRGLTTGADGKIYANTTSGIQRINPVTYVVEQTYVSAGGQYGIATLPDGRIAHSDSNNIWLLDPVSGVDTKIYTANSFIDGVAVDPSTGTIFLADLGSGKIHVITSTGTAINVFPVTHSPDGMAFGAGNAFANNTDGTITKISFAGPGFSGAATETIFASGGAYGDFATVGPDGAFYVTQYGPSASGIHWDNNTTDHSSIVVVRIASIDGGGFDPGPGVGAPDGGSLFLVESALAMLFVFCGQRRRKV
jgi:hypothetical protein